MFNHKYPYTDYHDINLDWLISEVEKIKTAEGVSFDDTINIDADNVQSAIEKIKNLIDTVSAQSQKIAVINNDIPDAFWVSGYVYNHMQTINQPTVKAIIDAMIDNKVVILKSTSTSGYLNTDVFYIQKEIIENTSEYWHKITLYDSFSGAIRILKINGLNDELNVNAEVLPESVKVINAEDVDFSVVTFTANNVKDALVEVDQKLTDFADATTNALNGKQDALNFDATPTLGSDNPVTSDGIKSALDTKQDALNFDATPTLGSDNPVTSDGIAHAIQASVTGVVEFNGRSGYVTPQASDYDASQIDFDPSTTSLSPNATTVQKAIEELAPSGITVTLTINGAKEDSITIFDSNNTQVGSCVFGAGQTSGTAQIVVPVGGGSYKFVSSVAKDTTTATTDYEKTVTLTDTTTQTVNVYPDNILFWYGNEVLTFTGGALPSPNIGSVIKNTNDITISGTMLGGSHFGKAWIFTDFDFSTANNIHVMIEDVTFDDPNVNSDIRVLDGTGFTTTVEGTFTNYILNQTKSGNAKITFDVSAINTTSQLLVYINPNGQVGVNNTLTLKVTQIYKD